MDNNDQIFINAVNEEVKKINEDLIKKENEDFNKASWDPEKQHKMKSELIIIKLLSLVTYR